jgi:hypothetical protein
VWCTIPAFPGKEIAMTPQEHTLLIGMFTRQMQATEAIFQILKSKGVIESDDPNAFTFSVRKDAASNEVLLRQCSRDYELAAKLAGVQLGLEIP